MKNKASWIKACADFKSAYGRNVKSLKEYSVLLAMAGNTKSTIYDQIRKYHIVNKTLPDYEQVFGFVSETVKSNLKSDSTYYSGGFSWLESTIKGKRKYFVEGYASTTDEDDYNEIVTDEGQEDLLDQFRDKIITLDIEHDDWIDENGAVLRKPKTSTLPVGKVVHAELRDKGVWVKVEINDSHPNFSSIWDSIKRKFLHSFSIGFWEVEVVTREIGGQVKKFISRLHLNNLTLTGNPVNTNATFMPVMKAILKSKEEDKMTEENEVQETQEVEENNAEAPKEDSKQEPVKESPEEKDEKSNDENLIKQVADVSVELSKTKDELVKEKQKLEDDRKAFENERSAFQEQKQTIESEISGPLSQIKAHKKEISQLKDDISNLKADLSRPILKAKIEHEDVSGMAQLSKKDESSVLSLIN